MREFVNQLQQWLAIQEKFSTRNAVQWREMQGRIFPITLPERAEWSSPSDIVSVLSLLGSSRSLNHLFFPSGGGLDLTTASVSASEEGCIELVTQGLVSMVRPKRLLFERVSSDDAQWSYFRLEAATLAPSGVYPDIEQRWPHEEVTDLGRGDYVVRSYYDDGWYGDERLPDAARVVTRYFRGDFVVFQKAAIYNRAKLEWDAYDGRHAAMTTEEFRSYIRDFARRFAREATADAS